MSDTRALVELLEEKGILSPGEWNNKIIELARSQKFEGYVDICNSEIISGWAWDKERPNTPINITVYDNDNIISKVPCNIFNSNLLSLGKGNGQHRFHFTIPDDLKDGLNHLIHVKYSDNDLELHNSPINTLLMSHRQYEQHLRSHISVLWNIEDIQIKSNFIEIRGWAIVPSDIQAQISFTINDSEFDLIKYPLNREDIGQTFWYIPQSDQSGFVCRAKISNKDDIINEQAVFKLINKETNQPLLKEQNIYYYDDKLPLPEIDRRLRVHGSKNECTFRLIGYSTYVKLELALKRLFNRGYREFSSILDWGCGCGRVTRYFQLPSIMGVDVDSDNINWCKSYLKPGNFSTIPLHPPTQINNNSFDLLIGISIYTHLKEEIQIEWLQELQRIPTDDAIFLMTIHGNTSFCRSNPKFSLFEALYTRGIVDFIPSPDFDGIISESDYYRITYHTPEYIREVWGRYFDIIEIIPGYIGNNQDLVVMCRIS